MIEKIKPEIKEIKPIASSRLFNIEAVDLEFSNGAQRTFERLKPGSRKAVVIVALQAQNTILLVNEYAVGTEQYELGLPKGLVDVGETLEAAANRELQEEVGKKAEEVKHIISLALAPNYMSHTSELMLAYGLSDSKLEGDEPEPLEVVPFNLQELDSYVHSGKITEVRSIACLYIIKNYLYKNQLY